MIYQLLKTTPYLTGQVRIDLVADRLGGDSDILLDEVHVVPINDGIWYNCPEDQINFKHTDNIVSLYNAIQDKFYSDEGSVVLSGKYPYYSSGDEYIDSVDHTYQMGLRRMPKARYGKDMSFFTPMWISIDGEDFGSSNRGSSKDIFENIEFFATVYSARIVGDQLSGDVDHPLLSKRLQMSERLKKYLSEYVDGVNSDLVYVGLREKKAYMNGVNVTNGATITKDISEIIPTLLDRERPLIETDNIISRKFAENKMIAKQFLNLNICFNMSDLFSANTLETIMWNPLNVVITARLKKPGTLEYEEIELKDIYSNYEDIYSYKISGQPTKPGYFVDELRNNIGETIIKFNVLDYLRDYDCIDLIQKNKMVQPNVHWAFKDNLEYTWNLYNGFSPMISERQPYGPPVVKRVEGRFFGTPDVISREYAPYRDNLQWISVIDMDTTVDLTPGFLIGSLSGTRSTTSFKPNQWGYCWSKGIKYNMGNILSRGLQVLGAGLYPAPSEIRANVYVLKKDPNQNLESDKIYAAVKRLGAPVGEENSEDTSTGFADYVSIFILLEGNETQSQMNEIYNKLTLPSVTSMLTGQLSRSSMQEFKDVMYYSPQYFPGDISQHYYENGWDSGCFGNLFILEDPSNPPAENDKALDVIRALGRVFGTVEYPNIIRFDKTLSCRLSPAPYIEKLVEEGKMDIEYTTEFNYTKVDSNYNTYLFRYDGNIIPQFIDPVVEYGEKEGGDKFLWRTVSGPFNKIYRKKQWKDMDSDERSVMNYISNQKYQPDYPSIRYYYIESENQDMHSPFIPAGYLGEICWFVDNLIYFVPDTIVLNVTCRPEDLDIMSKFHSEAIKHGFFKFVNDRISELSSSTESTDIEEAERLSTMLDTILDTYVYNMYKHDIDWEYADLSDIYEYNYTITYSLV